MREHSAGDETTRRDREAETPVDPVVRLPVREDEDETPAPTSAGPEASDAPRAWPWMLLVLLVAVAARAWRLDAVRPDAAGVEQLALAESVTRPGGDVLHPAVPWGGAGAGHVTTGLPLHAWLLGSVAEASGRPAAEIGPALNLAVFALTALALYALVRRLFDPPAAAFAVLAFAAAPFTFELSRSLRAEPLHGLAAVTALAAFATWVLGGHALAAPFAALALAAALAQDAAHAVLALPLVAIAARAHGWRLFTRPGLWVFAVLAVGAAAAWHAWSWRLGAADGNVLAGVAVPEGLGAFPRGDARWGELALAAGRDVALALATPPGLLLLGVGLLSGLLAARGLPLLAWLAGLALLVAALPRERAALDAAELLPLAVVVAAAMGQAASRLARTRVLSRPAVAALLAAVLVAAGLALRGAYAPAADPAAAERATFAARLAGASAPDERVLVAAAPDGARPLLAGRHTLPDDFVSVGDPRVLHAAGRRGWTLDLDQLGPERLEALSAAGARALGVWHPDTELPDAVATTVAVLGPPRATGPGWSVYALAPPDPTGAPVEAASEAEPPPSADGAGG